jgi:putative flippase GtrA
MGASGDEALPSGVEQFVGISPPHVIDGYRGRETSTGAHVKTAFGRFLVVGAASYLFGVLANEILLIVGVPYLTAAALAYVAAMANSFVWNRVWTFRAVNSRPFSQGARFVAVAGAVLCVYLAVVRLTVFAGMPEEFAQPAAALTVAPLSFSVNRAWTFAENQAGG